MTPILIDLEPTLADDDFVKAFFGMVSAHNAVGLSINVKMFSLGVRVRMERIAETRLGYRLVA